MSSLKPDHVRNSLLVSGFGRGNDLPPPGDPVTTLPMMLEVTRIKTYDGNVRLVPNPKAEELRLAIQTQGPEAAGVLPITRRPGDDSYMIARGGNTRLQIIQALWAQTQDNRFRAVQCLFHPWPGEAKVLADHIAENENRGEMIFIEKALALRALKQKMEQETSEAISLREFERRLNDPAFKFGLRVSKSQLHRLQYAADFLYPLLPETLKSGLGPRQVEHIQKLESLFLEYWRRGDGQGSEESFRALFADVLSRHDGPEFTIESVRHALERRLADLLDRSLHTIQASIAALEAGIEIGEALDEPDLDEIIKGSPALPRPWPEQAQAAVPPPVSPGAAHSAPTPPSSPRAGSTRAVGAPRETVQELSIPPSAPAQDASAWRADALACARRLAAHRGLEACITEASHGLGFWVQLPAHSIASEATKAALWWMLVGLAEQIANQAHVLAMPATSELRGLVTANRWEEIYARVGRGSSWIVLPHQLRLSDAEFEELVQLFRTVRGLRAVTTEAELWSNDGGNNDGERAGR